MMRETLNKRRIQPAESGQSRAAASSVAAGSAPRYPHRILKLQRTLGNHRVSRLVQSKRLTARANTSLFTIDRLAEPSAERHEHPTLNSPLTAMALTPSPTQQPGKIDAVSEGKKSSP